MSSKGQLKIILLSAGIVLLLAAGMLVGDVRPDRPIGSVRLDAGRITWQPVGEAGRLAVRVTGPDGFVFDRQYEVGDLPTLSSIGDDGAPLRDGTYRFEIVVIPESSRVRPVDSDEQPATRTERARQVQTGVFTIQSGSIVSDDVEEKPMRPAPQLQTSSVSPEVPFQPQDQVILDDLIVDGSACIGPDCVNGESFGFDTIRLKENNLRLKFDDTSNSASFPRNDWQLTANDTSNGGANKFSIDDITNGRTPFTVEAGAPSHSLYVDDGGRLGLGTNAPVVEVHVKDGDTPTMRLEQDGSSGFTPQTWDVAGNETNFFVRDVSHGSLLPFRIRPGAPTSSIDVFSNKIQIGKTTQDVGMGTDSPAEELHILRTGTGATRIQIENSNATAQQVGINFKNVSDEWRFVVTGVRPPTS